MRRKKEIPGGIILYHVNTQALLDQFFWQLAQSKEHEMSIELFTDFDEEFMKHFC